ncbi:MAG: helix-turn-helix transcriptional regulator [Thermoanaerobaculia bacterium]|nr:helix-turn-helix transcriptional regulator [Thermoanaerobaculia bacterium]
MPAFEGLGKALRWLREKQNKRQYQVADTAGITKAMLSAYETGKQKPSLETLEKILEALELGLPELSATLDLVNERRLGGPLSTIGSYTGARSGDSGSSLYQVLQIEQPLPHEEEQALSEMLHGFHRLIRYLHRTIADASDSVDTVA